MSGNKFARAAANRSASSGAAPAPETKATMTTTVLVSRHTRAELDKLFAQLTLEHHVRLGIGPVSVALYEMFLDNVTVLDKDGNPIDLQKEVINRLK